MSAAIGQEFLVRFQDEIGLTDAELAALEFFRGGFASLAALERDIFTDFAPLRGIATSTNLRGPISILPVTSELEVGEQIFRNYSVLVSALNKAVDYLRNNFDYEPIPFPAAVGSASSDFATAINPSLADVLGNLPSTASFAISILERGLLFAPAAVEVALITLPQLAAASNLRQLFDAGTPADLLQLIEITQNSRELAVAVDAVFNILSNTLLTSIELFRGNEEGDLTPIIAAVRSVSNLLSVLEDQRAALAVLEGAASIFDGVSALIRIADDLMQLGLVREVASSEASDIIDLVYRSRVADFVSAAGDVFEGVLILVPGLESSPVGRILSAIEAVIDAVAGAYVLNLFEQVAAEDAISLDARNASFELFNALSGFLVDFDSQIGMTAGVAEALSPPVDLSAPVFLSDSAVLVDDDASIILDIDVAETGPTQLAIIGGLDADLFAIVDGRLVFASETAREAADANGDGVFDVLVQATNAAGLSAQRAFRIQFEEDDAPAPPTVPAFVDVIGISSAETIEGSALQFIVQLSGIAPRDVSVSYAIDLQTAEANDLNFAPLTGQITIQEGDAFGTLTLPTFADFDSDAELVTVTLTSASGGGVLTGSLSATGVINDVAGAADLIVSNISIDRSEISHDGFAIATITVQNVGDADAGASSVLLNITDAGGQMFQLGEVGIGALGRGAGQTVTVRIAQEDASSIGVDAAFTLPATIASGELTLSALADAGNNVPESNGSNNTSTLVSVDILPEPQSAGPDLVVSNFEVLEGNVQPGEQVTFSWTITNIGDGGAASAFHGLFFSDTNLVSDQDQRLQFITTDFLAAGQSQSGTTTAFIGPNFDIGVITLALIADIDLDGSGSRVDEANEENNVSGTVPLLVGDTPNVGGVSLVFDELTFTPGELITGTVVVTNNSPSDTFAGTVRVVLSEDETIGANDQNLTNFTVPELDAGESVELDFSFFVPEGTESGQFFAGAFIEDIPGDTDTSDNIFAPVVVTVPIAQEESEGRDITFTSFALDDLTPELGGAVTASYTVANLGNADLFTGGAVRFYASSDAVFSADDVVLETFSFSALGAGESQDFNISLPIDANLGLGDAHIIAVIEPGPGRSSFGELIPADDNLSNNTASQQISIQRAGEIPPDGQLVEAWINGPPASGTWTHVIRGANGAIYDIDVDGGIRNGLGSEARGDGGFARDAYRWRDFRPEEARYDQEGRGLAFTGTANGLEAQREVFVTTEGTEFVRFLDSVTNTTDAAVEFTFSYALDIDLRNGNNVDFSDLIPGNPVGVVSETHTFISGVSSSFGALREGPSWSWSVGERGFFEADSFTLLQPFGDRFRLETTVTIEPGETASFLHFGDTSSRLDGSATDYSIAFSENLTQFDMTRLEGLTPEDIQNVINFDVSLLTTPADLSITANTLEVEQGSTLVYDVDIENEGSLTSADATLEIRLTDMESGEVVSVPLDVLIPLGRTETQSITGRVDISGLVGDGTYSVTFQIVHPETAGDANASNDVLEIANTITVTLFSDGDDDVTLPASGVFDAGDGDDTVNGSIGDDDISGGAGTDVIFGGNGNDRISDSTTSGLTDENFFFGEDGDDALLGNAGSDLLDGGDGADTLEGRAGNDELRGRDGIDVLAGGAGNDVLEGGLAGDLIDGGEGRDQAIYASSSAAVFVSLETGEAFGGDAEGDVLTGIEDIGGSAFDDFLIGDNRENRLFGGDGNDLLSGGLGADELDGEAGFDLVDYRTSSEGVQISLVNGSGFGGDAEGDTLFSIEGVLGSALSDVLIGGSDSERFEAGGGDDRLFGSEGEDHLDGGAGIDSVDYLISVLGVEVNLFSGQGTAGDAAGDTVLNVENVNGSLADDVLIGDNFGNILNGRSGDDIIQGGGGNDTLIGGAGADTLDGGEGFDTASFATSTAAVSLNLSDPAANTGGALGDQFVSIEAVLGSTFSDSLIGDTVSNSLSGGSGDDFISGGDEGAVSADGSFVFRVFQATLDRAPDLGGFEFFSGGLEAGTFTRAQVINIFVNSAEFQNTFGLLDDGDFVELLFNNVLDRPSDAGGFAFFTGQLENGASRASVVTTFIASPEFVANTEPLIAAFSSSVVNGSVESDVFNIFQAALGRQTDAGGLAFFAQNLQSGTFSFDQVLNIIISSAEFQQNFASLSNTEFVESLFQNALGRAADAGGLAFFVGQLDTGTSRASIITDFINSPEFATISVDDLDAFLTSISNNLSDVLEGGSGDDDLIGGIGGDTFVFDAADGGQDRVLDFAVNGGDVVELLGAPVTDFAALIALGAQDGADTVFDFGGGNTLTLANVDLDTLDADDFEFATGIGSGTGSGITVSAVTQSVVLPDETMDFDTAAAELEVDTVFSGTVHDAFNSEPLMEYWHDAEDFYLA